MCFVEKVFIEISQNSQENACATVSLLIQSLQAWDLALFLCILQNFKNTFFTGHLRRQLLNIHVVSEYVKTYY